MFQLWAASKLTKLAYSLRRDIYFYAPLLDSLDFYGIDPVTYARAGTTTAAYRGGSKTIAANVPPFEWTADVPDGLYLNTPATLTFSTQNALSDSDTLIWFEEGVPKSTPTNTNPFNGSGAWAGTLDIHIKHICKANRVLSNSEITQIQTAMADVAQSIPAPPEPPTNPTGSFITEVPAHVGGAVYETSHPPNLNSLLTSAHGGIWLYRVAATPGNMEYTAGGTGNKTLTLGLAPTPSTNILVQYVVA